MARSKSRGRQEAERGQSKDSQKGQKKLSNLQDLRNERSKNRAASGS